MLVVLLVILLLWALGWGGYQWAEHKTAKRALDMLIDRIGEAADRRDDPGLITECLTGMPRRPRAVENYEPERTAKARIHDTEPRGRR